MNRVACRDLARVYAAGSEIDPRMDVPAWEEEAAERAAWARETRTDRDGRGGQR